MKIALFALLFAALSQACAQGQSSTLFAPLPSTVDGRQAMEVARQVLTARGWTLVPEDRASVEGRKDNSGVRIFAKERELRFTDLSLRPKGSNAREHRENGPHLAAIPQPEINGLRADLAAAFGGKFTAVPGSLAGTPSAVLIDRIPSDLSSRTVMNAAQRAFTGRRWNVRSEGEDVFVANIRNIDTEATLRVFYADGALRYSDRTTNRYGEKSRLPERWILNLRSDISNTLATLPRGEPSLVPQPAPSAGDPVERLRRLKSALDAGLITPAEYESKRAEILKGL